MLDLINYSLHNIIDMLHQGSNLHIKTEVSSNIQSNCNHNCHNILYVLISVRNVSMG